MLTVLYSLVLALIPVLGLAGAGHALLYKRDPRAAFGWIAVCLMFPLAGPMLYFVFGVNRVQTRAQELSRRFPFSLGVGFERGDHNHSEPIVEPAGLPVDWQPLARISGTLLQRPLLEGNDIEPLHNGEEAFPAMLAAIEAAQTRVWLASYIFESNHTGRRFIDALARAQARGRARTARRCGRALIAAPRRNPAAPSWRALRTLHAPATLAAAVSHQSAQSPQDPGGRCA